MYWCLIHAVLLRKVSALFGVSLSPFEYLRARLGA
jgi:hypothetical protein